MNALDTTTSAVPSPEPATVGSATERAITSDLLRQILQTLQQDRRRYWVELIRAFVLGLATVASAWCAYQAARWGGVQTVALAEAGKADRHAMKEAIEAVQFRGFDALMLIHYVRAREESHASSADFLSRRFRPEMKAAVDAWLATDPFNDPAAPASPFQMPQYVQAEQRRALEQQQLAGRSLEAAHAANQNSDGYILLTVAFASALFFGGIGGTFQSYSLRAIVSVAALVVFLTTTAMLMLMPVAAG